MFKLLKLEFKRAIISNGFLISLGLGLVFILIPIIDMIEFRSDISYVQSWMRGISKGRSFIGLFFSLLVAIPYASSLAVEKKNHFLNCICVRENRDKYLFAKGLANALIGGLVLLIPALVLFILSISLFKNPIELGEYAINIVNDPLSMLIGTKPMLYILFYCLWIFFQGIVWSTLAFSLSLISNNSLFVTVVPFLYSILGNFLFAIIGMSRFTPPSSFAPYIMDNATVTSMMFQPMLLMFVTVSIIIYYKSFEEKFYG